MWLVGVGLTALVGVAYALLYQDAVGGYRDIVPVYLFRWIDSRGSCVLGVSDRKDSLAARESAHGCGDGTET
jgi:hypothetical protein